MGGAEETAQQLQALVSLAGDLSSVSSTHVVAKSLLGNFSSRGSDPIFCLLKVPGMHIVYIRECRQIHAHKNKSFFKRQLVSVLITCVFDHLSIAKPSQRELERQKQPSHI